MLFTQDLYLRSLESTDINSNYLNWLNDPQVNRYLETRFLPQSIEALSAYWKTHSNDPSSPWFAICLASSSTHIGNIKIGPINWVHRRADISLFIGDSSCWGKGYASQVISCITEWAFSELNLEKLNAGIYSDNLPSLRAFQKCGFRLEGTLRDEVYCRGKRMNVNRVGITRNEWETNR